MTYDANLGEVSEKNQSTTGILHIPAIFSYLWFIWYVFCRCAGRAHVQEIVGSRCCRCSSNSLYVSTLFTFIPFWWWNQNNKKDNLQKQRQKKETQIISWQCSLQSSELQIGSDLGVRSAATSGWMLILTAAQPATARNFDEERHYLRFRLWILPDDVLQLCMTWCDMHF